MGPPDFSSVQKTDLGFMFHRMAPKDKERGDADDRIQRTVLDFFFSICASSVGSGFEPL
jgi:hypothetical protein